MAAHVAHVALEHHTSYRYERPVRLSPHVVRLRPAPHAHAEVLAHDQRVGPAHHSVRWHRDVFGNHVARYVFQEPTDRLEIRVALRLRLAAVNPFDFLLEPDAGEWPVAYDGAVARALQPSLATSPPTASEAEFLAEARSQATAGRATTDVLVACNQLVHDTVRYEERAEEGVQEPTETLERGVGSCRDLVWLLVAVLRRLGLGTRFTSGYLVEVADDLGTRDHVELHAWAEAYLPGAGWVGLDPTSGVLATEGHVPLATATEPALAAPVVGTAEAAAIEFSHTSTLTRVDGGPAGDSRR